MDEVVHTDWFQFQLYRMWCTGDFCNMSAFNDILSCTCCLWFTSVQIKLPLALALSSRIYFCIHNTWLLPRSSLWWLCSTWLYIVISGLLYSHTRSHIAHCKLSCNYSHSWKYWASCANYNWNSCAVPQFHYFNHVSDCSVQCVNGTI